MLTSTQSFGPTSHSRILGATSAVYRSAVCPLLFDVAGRSLCIKWHLETVARLVSNETSGETSGALIWGTFGSWKPEKGKIIVGDVYLHLRSRMLLLLWTELTKNCRSFVSLSSKQRAFFFLSVYRKFPRALQQHSPFSFWKSVEANMISAKRATIFVQIKIMTK